MDLSTPISSIIPSLDGHVLQTLAASNAPLSLTEVHRRARTGSLSGVRKVLQRLTEHGVVDHSTAGYVLNQDHLAAPAVTMLARLHGELSGRIRGWLEQYGDLVLAAGLFGSAARRDGHPHSDVDVVIVTSQPARSELADELADAIERWTGNRGHIVVLSDDEARRLRAEERPIVDAWRTDLQMLIGDRSDVVG